MNGYPVQLEGEHLKTSKPLSLEVFGDWAKDPEKISKLQSAFSDAYPYPHVLVPNFLREDLAKKIEASFPGLEDPGWYIYNNPTERKWAMNHLSKMPCEISDLLTDLNTPETVDLMKRLTGFNDLEADPYLHGGGIHAHPAGGKLDIHLDYYYYY